IRDLGRYIAALTASNQRAIVLVAVDIAGKEHALMADSGPQPQPGTIDAADLQEPVAGLIRIAAQRYDVYVGSEALPLTIHADRNAYGVVYLRALLPIRPGEGPFGTLMPGMPARIGVVRTDGEILLAWPNDGATVGRYATELTGMIPAIRPGAVDFVPLKDFP